MAPLTIHRADSKGQRRCQLFHQGIMYNFPGDRPPRGTAKESPLRATHELDRTMPLRDQRGRNPAEPYLRPFINSKDGVPAGVSALTSQSGKYDRTLLRAFAPNSLASLS